MAMRNPFDLDDAAAYRRWREWKLDTAPRRVDELVVPVGDPLALTPAETAAIVTRCRRWNMALYASADAAEDSTIPRELGRQLGLTRLDANWLADEDGVSRVEVSEDGARPGYIPYTNRPINWHTDGYYNGPGERVRGMVLHCVRPAAGGGVNALMDHERLYILLRDRDPEFVRALSQQTAMTIPPRVDELGEARAAQPGPVFSVDAGGDLHMRYTARTRSIVWADQPVVRSAVATLGEILASAEAPIFRLRLVAGMGLVCNNVLHDRSGFEEDPDAPRLLYRARYFDRVRGSESSARDAFVADLNVA